MKKYLSQALSVRRYLILCVFLFLFASNAGATYLINCTVYNQSCDSMVISASGSVTQRGNDTVGTPQTLTVASHSYVNFTVGGIVQTDPVQGGALLIAGQNLVLACDASGNPSTTSGVRWYFGGGGTSWSLNLTAIVNVGEACTPCTSNVTFRVSNTTSSEQHYFFMTSVGQIYESPAGGNVGPYSTANISRVFPCVEAAAGIGLWQLGSGSIPSSNTGLTPYTGSETGAVTNGPAPSLFPDYSATLTNINLWTATNLSVVATGAPAIWAAVDQNIAGIIGTQTNGFTQSVAAQNAAATQAHSDANGVVAAIGKASDLATANGTANANGIVSAVDKVRVQAHSDSSLNAANLHNDLLSVVGAVNGLTNGTGAGISNYFTESTGIGMSNLLSQIATNLSSSKTGSITDYSNLLASLMHNSTNAATATSFAQAALSDATSALQGVIDGIDPDPQLVGDPGHTSVWEFDFCGRHCDVDPVSNFPGVFAFSLGLWSFILVAAYFLDVGNMYWKAIQVFSSQQIARFPNVQMELFGTGGNVLGVAIGVVIPAVFVALWVIGVTLTVGGLGSLLAHISGLPAVVTAFTSSPAGAAAWHLTTNSFPVGLAVHLLSARILLRYTLAKACLIASAASRWLAG